jgi:hypothetical protein
MTRSSPSLPVARVHGGDDRRRFPTAGGFPPAVREPSHHRERPAAPSPELIHLSEQDGHEHRRRTATAGPDDVPSARALPIRPV